jgi:hypothetical protein
MNLYTEGFTYTCKKGPKTEQAKLKQIHNKIQLQHKLDGSTGFKTTMHVMFLNNIITHPYNITISTISKNKTKQPNTTQYHKLHISSDKKL